MKNQRTGDSYKREGLIKQRYRLMLAKALTKFGLPAERLIWI